MRAVRALACILAVCSSYGLYAYEYPARLRQALETLDTAIDNRANYEAQKTSRIAHLEQLLAGNAESWKSSCEIRKMLYAEYADYQSDKALECLKQNLQAARAASDASAIAEANIMLGFLYANIGYYVESCEALDAVGDTLSLTDDLRLRYYLSRQKLNNELINYSRSESIVARSIREARFYTDALIAELPPDSFDCKTLRIIDYISHWKLGEAEGLCMTVLDEADRTAGEYAQAAYLEGVICCMTSRDEDMAYWYARAAAASITACVNNNAALYSLADWLLGKDDVTRALRYIRISLDDASFCNADRRMRQISTRMADIETSAHRIEEAGIRQMRAFTMAILALSASLLIALMYVIVLYRRTVRDKHLLDERNERITDANRRLAETAREAAEANCVKEEYISLFVAMCSDYIYKFNEYRRAMKRRIAKGQIKQMQQDIDADLYSNGELKEFYAAFDNIFLHLYPSFADDFNDLLLPEYRVALPDKGLNTELRVFALIRLGITNSSKIASILHLSVNTIYNYRAQVKNKARVPRADFESTVRHIGSFSAAAEK